MATATNKSVVEYPITNGPSKEKLFESLAEGNVIVFRLRGRPPIHVRAQRIAIEGGDYHCWDVAGLTTRSRGSTFRCFYRSNERTGSMRLTV